MSQRQTADSTVLCAEIFAGSAMTAIKLINIINQLDYSLFRNILAQPAAEFSRKIILTVRKSTGTAKTAHDITRDTTQAMIHFFCSQRALTPFDWIAFLQHDQPDRRIFQSKFISCENSRRATADNRYIIVLVHKGPPFIMV